MPEKKTRAVLSDTRDIPMLVFIWRWKVATTAVLHRKYFTACDKATAYHRLRRLAQAGCIKSVCDPTGNHFVWMLERRGYEAIRGHLPALKEEGFRSENIHHDLLVAAFHLGDWLIDRPENHRFFSEQQHRRFDKESWPDFVPTSDSHRPDGFTFFSSKNAPRLIAFEVELNQKRSISYGDAAVYYDYSDSVYRVLWLVNGNAFCRRLHDLIMRECRRKNFQNFVLLADFEKQGWQAPIRLGPEKGQTVRKFLHPQNAGQKPQESPSEFCTSLWLDGRKSFVNTRCSAKALMRQKALLPPYTAGHTENQPETQLRLDENAQLSYSRATSPIPSGLPTQQGVSK